MNLISEKDKATLIQFENILLKWNKKINLISKNTECSIWNRHILDSIQLLEYLDKKDIIFDLGSGAGFPGFILSVCGIKQTYLFESDTRKSSFLNFCSSLSNNKITIINDRIEEIDYETLPKPDVITSRALAEINTLLSFYHIIQPRKKLLALKGVSYEKELDEASKNWHFDLNKYQSQTNPESVIIEISNVREKA
jgi:16S rRNA (guanine527-N7)-methyltransferase